MITITLTLWISIGFQIMTLGGNTVLMISLIICVCIVGSEEHNIVSLIVVQVKARYWICMRRSW